MQHITSAFKQLFVSGGDAVAIIDHLQQTEYSYRQVEDLSSRLASHLSAFAGKDARIALLYANQMEMALAYFACFHIGATVVPINPEYHADEIAGLLAHAQPDFVITSSAFAGKLASSDIPAVLLFGSAKGDQLPIASLPQSARLDKDSFPYARDDKMACIMFTSGSTGAPKAIPLRFWQLAGQSSMTCRCFGHEPGSRFYMMLPMAYIGGLQLLLSYLFARGSIVIDHAFSAAGIYRFWDTALAHGVTSLWLTPSMVATLLAVGTEDEQQAQRIRSQIRHVVVAMGALAPAAREQFETMFGLRVQKSFGITETLICCSWQGNYDTPELSVGKPMPGMQVVIISDSGEILPEGQEGDIRVRGDYVLEEYYRQPDITAASFDAKGYYITGDYGYMQDGNLFITGRIKDVIKRGGLNISPAELEGLLQQMPAVKDVAVIGVPDDVYGEKIAAVIVPHDGAAVSLQDVTRHCSAHVSSMKIPTIVHAIAQMPLNPTGKPDKKALRQLLAAGQKGKG